MFFFFFPDENRDEDEREKLQEKKTQTLPLQLISKLLYVADAEKPSPSSWLPGNYK